MRSRGKGPRPTSQVRNPDGSAYRTDGGNPVIDSKLGAGVDLAQLGRALDELPGVIGHGLFLTEAQELLIENETGEVTRRHRPGS